MEKTDKKRLCRVLDCQKLSPEVRAHVVKNERLPLRTVVQALFFDQEKGPSESNALEKLSSREILSKGKQNLNIREDQTPKGNGRAKVIPPESSCNSKDQEKMKRLAPELEKKLAVGEIEEPGSGKGKEVIGRHNFDPTKGLERSKSYHSSCKRRDSR